jgi:GIY-YIG catalytic domain
MGVPFVIQRVLLFPEKLWTRSEVLAGQCPIPSESGLYAWYITDLPVPSGSCHMSGGSPLVYVGIAPSRPMSRTTLRTRVKQHFQGNASASTLRLSLGCLLSDRLGIELRTAGRRLHFADGEAVLNDWLEINARVCWVQHPVPWEVEAPLIRELDLPLNLEHNADHPFFGTLRAARKAARVKAREGASVLD